MKRIVIWALMLGAFLGTACHRRQLPPPLPPWQPPEPVEIPVPPPPTFEERLRDSEWIECRSVTAGEENAEPSNCERVYRIFNAARECYADHVDSAARGVKMGQFLFLRKAPDGAWSTGLTYFEFAGQFVNGVYLYNFHQIWWLPEWALPFELYHGFDHVLHPQFERVAVGDPGEIYRWQIIGHGTTDDPLLGSVCTRFVDGTRGTADPKLVILENLGGIK